VASLKAWAEKTDRQLMVVDDYIYQDQRMSSSLVRQFLDKGDFKVLPHLLGRPYVITGVVRAGQQKGRLLGFPTANIWVGDALVVSGVYAARVGEHKAVVNIGRRPTVAKKERQRKAPVLLEVHFLGFVPYPVGEKTLLGSFLAVELFYKIRDEQCFSSLEELKKQIGHDIERATAFLQG
jgi:riboflavin kinase / FMN adenylyltransferase